MTVRDEIQRFVARNGASSPKEIAAGIGKSPNMVRSRVHEMLLLRELVRLDDGTYDLAEPLEVSTDGPAHVRLSAKLIAHLESTPVSRWLASERLLVAEYWRAQREEEERKRREEAGQQRVDIFRDVEAGVDAFARVAGELAEQENGLWCSRCRSNAYLEYRDLGEVENDR